MTLRVVSHGDAGPDVLLLPGITSPAGVWSFVAEPLARDHRVHVLDLRGRGESRPRPGATYTLEDYAGDAAAVIEGLGLGRPRVLGHSLGARIAAKLGVSRPELVARAVLADPPLSGPGRPPYPTPLAFYLDAIAGAREPGAAERLARDHPGWSDARRRDRARWLPTCDERAVAESHRHFHDEDFHALWDALPAPVLISGSSSEVVTSNDVVELRSRNPGARSIVVAGAGHMIPWDRPDAFLAAAREALA